NYFENRDSSEIARVVKTKAPAPTEPVSQAVRRRRVAGYGGSCGGCGCLSGWAPVTRSRVCALQPGDFDGLRVLRAVCLLGQSRSGVSDRSLLGRG
ncbi:hypothetical protein U1Q18_002520, partial [Sarracenia purpurea var. burkii]